MEKETLKKQIKLQNGNIINLSVYMKTKDNKEIAQDFVDLIKYMTNFLDLHNTRFTITGGDKHNGKYIYELAASSNNEVAIELRYIIEKIMKLKHKNIEIDVSFSFI